jgi:phytol kinase
VLVPFVITMQFALIGLGVIKDEASVKAMSRTGDPKEILRGPLYYGIMFVVLTLVYWKDSPIGIIALMMMCGGDGIADIIGRKFASAKLPWGRDKSISGTVSVFAGGFTNYLLPISVIALAGVVVESLHYKDIDNISMTLISALVGH